MGKCPVVMPVAMIAARARAVHCTLKRPRLAAVPRPGYDTPCFPEVPAAAKIQAAALELLGTLAAE